MKDKKVRVSIFNGKKMIKPWASLHEFPQESIVVGVQHQLGLRQGKKVETVEQFKDLKLCNYKDKWYICYALDRLTGGFESREKAIEWFETAGR